MLRVTNRDLPASCGQVLGSRSFRGHDKDQSVSPICCFRLLEIKVADESGFPGDIPGVIALLHVMGLVVKPANPFDHVVKDLFGDPVINDLKKSPGLGGRLNLLDNMFPARAS